MAQEARLTMVLVDTTVWIDFFAAKSTSEVAELERLLDGGEDICTCGVILAEVLQGIREDDDYKRTLSRFDSFLFLPMNRQTFLRAAELFRSLRRRGITIRKPIDCMIASVSMENDIALLHNDRDFDPIEIHCGLKVVKILKKPTRPSRRLPEGRG
jgi:predicted nucleic acid-binding protein